MKALEWQPIAGCSYASPGCTNCKTMKLASPEMREHFRREGLVTDSRSGPVWTGKLHFDTSRLQEPLSFSEPTAFYVCPHGDLFHENAPDEWIDQIFDVIRACPQHWFQIVTKRARRQREYVLKRFGRLASFAPRNVAFGVSCERQREADERIPDLIATPSAVRFVTLYPLLEAINLAAYLRHRKVSAVLAGEEDERPADSGWYETLQADCVAAGVQFVRSSTLIGSA